MVFNVTNEADVDRGISQFEKDVGTIDVFVNNAGIIKRIPILDMPIAGVKQVIATAQTAPVREGNHPFNDLVMTRTPSGPLGRNGRRGQRSAFSLVGSS